MEVPGDEFESKIYVKQNAGALVDRDLRAPRPVWGEHIAIGTATDPYQPAETRIRSDARDSGENGASAKG